MLDSANNTCYITSITKMTLRVREEISVSFSYDIRRRAYEHQ